MDVHEGLNLVIQQWNQMSQSHMDDAGDDADRFQMTFYQFIEALKVWVHSLHSRPADAEAAREDPAFAPLFEALPEPLHIPFETELDAILAYEERRVDSSEQS